MIRKFVADLCMELLACNIDLEAPLLQTIKLIVGQARKLEERVEKMEEEYKAHIMELEAKGPVMPSKQREARIEELKVTSATIVLCIDKIQKLLDEATSTWSTIEEISDLIIVCEEVHKTHQELEAVATTMKDLPTLERMKIMGENKRL